MSTPKTPALPASEIIAAVDKLAAKRDPRTGKPIGRERAAARLLPQMKPDAAARYVRKLRRGERSGKELVQREPIRKRLRIIVHHTQAMVTVETVELETEIIRIMTIASMLPAGVTTPDELKAHAEYPEWVRKAEKYIRRKFHYTVVISDVLAVRKAREMGLREVVWLESPAA